MQHQIDRYLQEVPFITLPLSIVLFTLIIVRFLLVPEVLHYQEITEQKQLLPELHSEQEELLSRLRSAGNNLPQVPVYDTLNFNDASTLLHELFEIARPLNITFTETTPLETDGAYSVKLAFTSEYQKIGTFLTELEKYPLQLTVLQLAMERQRRGIRATFTVIGVPSL